MTNRILKKSSLIALLPFLFILGMTACGGDNHSNTDDSGSDSDGNETVIGPVKTVSYISANDLFPNVVFINTLTVKVRLLFPNRHYVNTDRIMPHLFIVFTI